jgi:hypothetical protein
MIQVALISLNPVPYVYNNLFPFRFRVLISDQHCSIPLRLRFLNSCKNDKYSKQKIEADDKTPLKIAIYNHKNEIITSEPFSSMRVHIVPIQGDFDNDHKGQWTEEYFRSKILGCKMVWAVSILPNSKTILVLLQAKDSSWESWPMI